MRYAYKTLEGMPEGKRPLRDLEAEGTIILKLHLRTYIWFVWTRFNGLLLSGFRIRGKLIDHVTDYHPLKKKLLHVIIIIVIIIIVIISSRSSSSPNHLQYNFLLI
jgi:hypothetical protein